MTEREFTRQGIHQDQPILAHGTPVDEARAVMIMVHGRGAGAQDILSIAGELSGDGVAYIAPQAAGNTWYPYSFLEPMEKNEPHLSSALQRLGELVTSLEEAGIPPERVVLLGFSQGACLVSEFAALNARRYAGVVGLSGGLIGPQGTPREYEGTLDGTPVFLGCSDVDPHIPVQRVHETEEVLSRLGGDVTSQIYPGMGHTVNRNEIEHVQYVLDSALIG